MDETTQIFLQNGILGAIIVVMGGVVLFLQKLCKNNKQMIGDT